MHENVVVPEHGKASDMVFFDPEPVTLVREPLRSDDYLNTPGVLPWKRPNWDSFNTDASLYSASIPYSGGFFYSPLKPSAETS